MLNLDLVMNHVSLLRTGLSIWKTDHSDSMGVVIMQVSPGGEADRSGKIKRGDEILQVLSNGIYCLSCDRSITDSRDCFHVYAWRSVVYN